MKFASLSTEQAAKKLAADGDNIIGKAAKKSRLAVFFGQYKDVMTLILLACTVLSFLMGEYAESIAIAVIVLLNGILGYWQEYRTERTLQSLSALSAPKAMLFRDGKPVKIDAAKVVRGDLLILNAGDRIPADAQLLEAVDLQCDEAVLTGESVPACKRSTEDIPIHNRLNDPMLVYAGCSVTRGHGLARVIDTGMDTQMGKIAHLLSETVKQTAPLQKKLDQMGKIIAVSCSIICVIVTVCGILRGEKILDMLLLGISLAVAAVPEGLAAIVTVSLAVSVARMKQRNALVRHLHAVETLGCASVICTDKTGTLTENRMTVTKAYTLQSGVTDAKNAHKCLYEAAFRCCKEAFAADPTERALTDAAVKILPQIKRIPILAELPFDSERKRMTVLCKEGDTLTVYTKGAPDYLLPLCDRCFDGKRVRSFEASDRHKVIDALQRLGEDGLRNICIAYKPAERISEENLIFLGILSLSDPPRAGVKQAVLACKRAGIRVCMVTGDHLSTAAKIAKDLHILSPGDGVMSGAELEAIPQAMLKDKIRHVSVFARVTPSQKLKIVSAFRSAGKICAMTGDGVNDAPALKQADIGVSMGKNGTDVAREASDIVLLDDDFTTLVQAVRCGRGVFDNIRKFLRYLLSCNIGEVLTMFIGLLCGAPVVLLPLQILLVNLVTDGLPAMALSLEPVEDAVMERSPRPLSEGVFSHGLGAKIIFRGILIGLSTLGAFFYILQTSSDLTAARSAALCTLVTAQLIHVFECRSEKGGLFTASLWGNKALLAAVCFSFCMLFAVLYLPQVSALFDVCALRLPQLGISFGFAFAAPILSMLFAASGKR